LALPAKASTAEDAEVAEKQAKEKGQLFSADSKNNFGRRGQEQTQEILCELCVLCGESLCPMWLLSFGSLA